MEWTHIVVAVLSAGTVSAIFAGVLALYKARHKNRQDDASFISEQWRKLLDEREAEGAELRAKLDKMEHAVDLAKRKYQEVVTDNIELR